MTFFRPSSQGAWGYRILSLLIGSTRTLGEYSTAWWYGMADAAVTASTYKYLHALTINRSGGASGGSSGGY